MCHLTTLADAAEDPGVSTAALVFADIDANSPDQWKIVEGFRKDYPRMKIVLTYMASPTGRAWESRIRNTVDVLVRKPYSVLEVDKAIGDPNQQHDG